MIHCETRYGIICRGKCSESTTEGLQSSHMWRTSLKDKILVMLKSICHYENTAALLSHHTLHYNRLKDCGIFSMEHKTISHRGPLDSGSSSLRLRRHRSLGLCPLDIDEEHAIALTEFRSHTRDAQHLCLVPLWEIY